MADLQLFQHVNYNGRRVDTPESVPDLRSKYFDDTVSSCIINAGVWMFYEDADFQGNFSILGRGRYRNYNAMGLRNDTLSSVRRLPEPLGPTILMFEKENFQGRMFAVTGAESNFCDDGFNDKVSSIIVLDGDWALYQHVDFDGTRWTVGPKGGPEGNGRYPTASCFADDTISSVRPDMSAMFSF